MNMWEECPFALVKKQREMWGVPIYGEYDVYNEFCDVLKLNADCPREGYCYVHTCEPVEVTL